MAKKRKLKDEQERGFQFPEFDEDEYIQKERRDAKITIVTLGYAFIFGMFSYSVALYGGPAVTLALFIGFGGMFSLRWFFGLAGVPVDELETKHIVGYSLLFLLTWLAIWVVMTNPPASDISDPLIVGAEVREMENGTWVVVAPPRTNEEYRVYAHVYDYGDIDTITIEVRRGSSFDAYTMIEDPENDNWYYVPDITFSASGPWQLVIHAEDTGGNSSDHTENITVSA